MRHVSSILASTAVICLAGCVSSPPLTVSGPVGPAPTEPAKASGGSSLQVYSATTRAPIDVNKEEFLWIEAGKRTRVNLRRGENPFVESVPWANAVFLGGDRIVGWQVRNSL